MASESDDKATEIGSGPNLNSELPQENIDSTEYKEFLEESSSLEPIDNPDVLAQKDKDIINQDPELKSVHNTLVTTLLARHTASTDRTNEKEQRRPRSWNWP